MTKALDKGGFKSISHLEGFTEWNPNPIIEMNSKGELTYTNLAARAQFPSLLKEGSKHPVLAGLHKELGSLVKLSGKFVVFSRELSYLNSVYEQQLFSYADKKTFYIYTNDITSRKRAEEELNKRNMELAQTTYILNALLESTIDYLNQLRINTELEEQNKLIQEANRLKDQFLMNMSHELRTPLNAVIGFSQLIQEETLGPVNDGQKEALSDVLKSAKHLLQILSNLLDITNIEFTRMEFTPEELSLHKIVTEVMEHFYSLAAKKKVKMTLKIDEGLTHVYLDPARLKQVFYNYLSNAMKFIPDEGQITIRVLEEKSGRFRLEVEDNGVGINPKDLKKLFIAFSQLDSGPAKKHPGGTGLGLSLTKHIVEAQGGEVGAVCTPEKNIFYAILPRRYVPKKKLTWNK